jgi:hypothetical protein
VSFRYLIGGSSLFSLWLSASCVSHAATIDSASLGPREDVAVSDGPSQTRVRDLDRDGKADIVVWNTFSGVVSLFHNVASPGSLSSSSFEARIDLPSIGAQDNYGCIVVDLDGDGKPEIVVPDGVRHQLVVFPNQTAVGVLNAASFGEPSHVPLTTSPQHVYYADLDGDGRMDLVATHPDTDSIHLVRNLSAPGALMFAGAAVLRTGTAAGSTDLVIQDFDDDGKPDLAVADSRASSITLFKNQAILGTLEASSFSGVGVLSAPSVQLITLSTDVDGDGKPDLVTGGYSHAVSVFRNQGSAGSFAAGSFAAPVDFATPGWTQGMEAGDLNGDGKPEIVAVGQLGDFMSVFENLSTPGSFTADSLGGRVDFATGWNVLGVSVGDLDGDNRPDVVFGNSYVDIITLYRNQVQGCASTPAGVVANWRAEGNALDSAGLNHGSLQGSISFAPGKVGSAFEFDDDSDYVEIPASASLNVGIGNGFTIELWTSPSSANTRPLVEWSAPDRDGVQVWIEGEVGRVYANVMDVNRTIHVIQAPVGQIQVGQLQHVALTYDKLSGLATFYYNGSLSVQENLGVFIPETSFALESRQENSSRDGPRCRLPRFD